MTHGSYDLIAQFLTTRVLLNQQPCIVMTAFGLPIKRMIGDAGLPNIFSNIKVRTSAKNEYGFPCSSQNRVDEPLSKISQVA